MIQITPHMRVLVAVDATDFRRGIDGLAQQCRDVLRENPLSGAVFVFRNRAGTAVKLLVYDGQGFWLCLKRLSSGRFRHWPMGTTPHSELAAHELQVLLFGGDPARTLAAPLWRPIRASSVPQPAPALSSPRSRSDSW